MTAQERFETYLHIAGQAAPLLRDSDKKIFAIYDKWLKDPNVVAIRPSKGKRGGFIIEFATEEAAKESFKTLKQ